MNWKVFLSACAAAALGFVPQNGISCAGGDDDPKDYFTSFFSRRSSERDESYRPFYYTMARAFYDSAEQDTSTAAPVNGPLIAGWSRYCGNATEADAADLVLHYSQATLEAVRAGLASNALPDSVRRNTAVRQLASTRNTAALDYLVFAKKTERLTWNGGEWEAGERDSLALARIIPAAQAATASASDPFLKERYALQAVKCAFYTERFADCIRLYDSHFRNGNTVVQQLALGYRAGSLYRLKRKKEAALEFSRAFAASAFNRRSNFLGFLWSSNNADSNLRGSYVALAPTPTEKAAMTGLFALQGAAPATKLLQQVYLLDKSSPLLPLVASREISKVEEQYLTPLLGRQIGYEESEAPQPRVLAAGKARASALARQLAGYGRDAALTNRAYYAAGAAYMYLLDRQFDSSRQQMTAAENISPTPAQKDQLRLLRLLLAADEPGMLGAAEEAALLPAAEWLDGKAATDPEYAAFRRDFYGQLLASRYKAAKNAARRTLVLSVSDKAQEVTQGWFPSDPRGLEVLHNELSSATTQQLFTALDGPSTAWERYLVQHAAINRNDAIETIGTAYIREGAYPKAIEWLQKADSLAKMQSVYYNSNYDAKEVNTDPFHDYLNDWQRYEHNIKTPYTKLTFARALLALQTSIDTAAAPSVKAKLLYRLGAAHYNMSQYGNAWMAVAWDRSSVAWNDGTYKTAWEREFFGLYKARDLFTKAYALTPDKEFRAACYFMMAKCAQKQIARPDWTGNMDYKTWEALEAKFQKKFRDNPLFPGFTKEFGGTRFYKYAFNRCSYLRDFVKKQAAPPTK